MKKELQGPAARELNRIDMIEFHIISAQASLQRVFPSGCLKGPAASLSNDLIQARRACQKAREEGEGDIS